jgi:hypothetical protein
LVTVFAAVASLADSLAAKKVTDVSQITAPVGGRELSRSILRVLAAMLMITYHTTSGEAPKLRPKRR